MSDSEIWSGIIKGDYNSFQDLYRTHFAQLYGYGIKICQDPVQVEDAIHDLFLDLWKYKEKLSVTTSVKFYLFRSLRRKIYKNQIDDQKVRVFDQEIGMLFEQQGEGREKQMIDEENESLLKEKLISELKKLPTRQYDALVLRFFNNFSYEEIAGILEMNEQSARNLVQRGLLKMRKLLLLLIFLISAFKICFNFF